MLPSTLDITREECRGILRRLELESYSNVVSTFRAQGGLNDIKKRILEDLRSVFHISQDRHRAEVRRVANDEKLCTIAEVISGPNTGQEWCQEGRRSFPLLARSFAYTAFSSVASAVTEKLIIENSKLPSSEIQQQKEASSEKIEIIEENSPNIPVVKEDPLKPSLDEKKRTKRPISHIESQPAVASSPLSQRKRVISNENKQLDENNQIHTNLRIQQIYHNHCKTVTRHKKPSATKRKISMIKETMVENTKVQQQQYKNNSTMNNIVETLPSVDDNKINLNVPNPQVLHTYASLSQKTITQNNSRNMDVKPLTYGGAIDTIQSSSQIKNSHVVMSSKKEISNNGLKLNLSQLKQTNSEEKKKDRISNSLHARQIQEKNVISNNLCQSPSVSNDTSSFPPRVLMIGNKPTTIIAEKNINKVEQVSAGSLDNSNSPNNKGTDINKEISNHLSVRRTSTNISSCSSPTVVQIKPPQSIVPLETRVVRELTVENSNVQQQEKSTFLNHSLPLVGKRKIHISNPQIIHPIKISSAGLQGIQNRKGIKIISSANGQMFIQSTTTADNTVINSSPSSPKLAKIIPTQKNVISTTRAVTPVSGIVSGNSITSTIIPNRVALQKVHIVPKTSKQQAILTKPSTATNQIFMQTSNVTNNVTITPEVGAVSTFTTESGNEIIKNQSFNRNVIVDKSKHESNIRLLQSVSTTNHLIPLPTQSPQAHNNVIVIGSIPPSKKETEDSSRDLINHNNGNQLDKNNMITEDTPVYILTAPVTNLDKSSIDLNCITTATTAATTEVDDQNFDHKTESVQIINNEITEVDEDEVQTENQELHIEFNEDNDEGTHNIIIDDDDDEKQSSKKEFIYEVTDWEVALDQEAIRTKEKNISQNSKIPGSSVDFSYNQQQSKNFIATATTTNGDNEDNFHDVIEVEGIESEESIVEETNINYEASYSSQII